jgi:hypothetical protein
LPNNNRILLTTSNFFRLYHHICGETEIPTIYHFWCCVALLSAALEDRVWYELYRDLPLKPNLYVCLLGPGSVGKGVAISQAVKLVEDSISTRVYRGKLTFAHLIDTLGKVEKDEWGREVMDNPKMWLVMDEFKNAVGSNKSLSEEFIALMTELYTATNYPLQTGTRTHGNVMLKKPCLNWLFGSNEPWLRQVLTKEIFESGFIARGCFIYADYNTDCRISRPKYPPDYDEVYLHLKTRLWMLQGYHGKFLITPTAEATLDQWYHGRKAPIDESLQSAWGRQREMLLRFAMILCVAEGQQMIIRVHHLQQGIQMVKQLEGFTSKLMYSAMESYESKPINWIAGYLERQGKEVSHSQLLRWARAKKGLNAEKVKNAIEHLKSEGHIWMGCKTTGRGGIIYRWDKGEE